VYKADGDNPEQLWEDYKAYAKKHSPPLWSKIEKGRLLGFQERVLTIGFPAGYLFLDDIRNKTQKERLAEISRGFFGDDVEVRIEIIKSDNGDPSGKTNPTAKNGRDFRQEALNHPLLQKVFDVFEGAELREIVPKI
jgi:hypothetical protein